MFPLQTRSVHADPAYAERIAETQKLLAATIREVDIKYLRVSREWLST